MARGPDDGAERPVYTGQRPPGQGWQRYQPASSPGDDELGIERRRSTRPDGRAPRGRRGRLAGYLLVAILALVIGAGVGYARAYFSDGEVGSTVTVVVKEGSSLRVIATALEAKGVVKHARAFEIRADADGYATRFMPGTYAFHVNEPYDTLVAKLLKGTRAPTVKVSIPEGSTLRQAARIVSGDVKAISEKEYLEAAREDPPPFKLEGYREGRHTGGHAVPGDL